LSLGKQASETTVRSGDVVAYVLGLTVSGNNANGVTVTDRLPPGVSYAGPGTNSPSFLPPPSFNAAATQLSWALPPLAPGYYQLAYQLNVNNLLTGGTVLTNLAVAGSLQISGPVSASASVTVAGEYTVKIGVYNEAGELVKVIFTQKYSQPVLSVTLQPGDSITSLRGANHAVTVYSNGQALGVWDGTAQNGDPVSNGVYHFKVDNIDITGVVTSITRQVTVSRNLRKCVIRVYNEAGETVKHLYSEMNDPGKTSVVEMKISSTVIQPGLSPPAGTPSRLTISLNDGTTVTWDGTGDNGAYVQTGQYFVEVHTVDGLGGSTTVTKPVLVVESTGEAGKVTAGPNRLNPSNGYLVTFRSGASRGLTLNVSLYTTAGERVATVAGVPGSGQVTWDASGKASGLYLAVVELLDSSGGNMGRQILKLIVVH
jgi:uncharacterized repeat protein (TIGR01451 family)